MGQMKRARIWQKGRASAKSVKKTGRYGYKAGAGLYRASRMSALVTRPSSSLPAALPYYKDPYQCVNLKGVGLPDSMIAHLVGMYSLELTNGSANTVASQAFYLNSIFSPLSGGGGQPRYHDQLIALYNKSCVYCVDWEVTAFDYSTTISNQIGIFKSSTLSPPAPTTPALLFQARELSGCVGYGSMMNDGNGTVSRYTQRGRIWIAELFGISKTKVYEEDAYSAISNANPSDLAQLTVFVAARPGDTSSTVNVHVEVRLVFHCKLTDRIETIGAS